MELHFLFGFPKTGKSTFVHRYCKNEKIKNFHTFDFNIQFKKYFQGLTNDLYVLNKYLSTINSNNIFIEIPIKNVGHHNYKILEKFTIEWINKNITISNNYKKEDIFIHIFETNDPSFEYIFKYDGIHNLLIHQYCLLFDNYIKYFDMGNVNNIERDEEFDWNIMYTKDYLNFKSKYGLRDFVLLKETSNIINERTYDSDWTPCNYRDENVYNSLVEILKLFKNTGDLKSVDYFEGKELETKGMVTIEYLSNDYYSTTLYKYELFSIPHFFKFLKGD